MEDFKSTPVAKVQFINTASGGVRFDVLVQRTPGECGVKRFDDLHGLFLTDRLSGSRSPLTFRELHLINGT